eukprot:gene11322-12508_t
MLSHSKQQEDLNSPPKMLYSLCEHVLSRAGRQTNLPDDLVSMKYQYALKMIGSHFDPSISTDDFQLAEKIKRKFVRQKKETEAALFSNLFRKLQSKNILQNKWAIIYFFDLISNSSSMKQGDKGFFYGNGLPAFSSTPLVSITPFARQPNGTFNTASGPSSGIGSRYSDSKSHDPTPDESSFAPRQHDSSRLSYARPPKPEKRLSAVATLAARSLNAANASEFEEPTSKSVVKLPRRSGSFMLRNTARDNVDGGKFEVTEQSLLRDILYVFQGIEGRIIKYDEESEGYRISVHIGVPFPIRDFIDKLNELGWLFRKVRKFLAARVGDKALGLVGQSFCSAVHKELTEYYKLLAILEAQQNQSNQAVDALTLRRLMVWTNDPLIRMKALATVVDLCKGKKGGSLLSAIYSNTKIGDPYVKNLMKHILNVSLPIKNILERWIYEGELQDAFHEFFVAADPAVRYERLWHEKYSLRKLMIPSFIPLELATKILNIGKSINFIRVVCKDREAIGDQAIVDAGSDTGYSKELKEFTSSALDEIIDVVYKKTSKRLLDILFNKYKFLDHLQAMRRYLLLGQGDFIRHLMDLLQSDLARPANTLYMHNLTGVLEAAIRATNAQYDEADILKRLDCRLLEISPGDCGWDVFSLDYHVDGPICTVLECCWEELLEKVSEANDLDHVIAAHETFLDQVMRRALLDNESRAMLTQLRAIFDLIIQFQGTQESMYNSALDELRARQRIDKLAEKRTDQGNWGITDVDTEAEYKRSENFERKFIPSTRAQLRVLHQSYQSFRPESTIFVFPFGFQ